MPMMSELLFRYNSEPFSTGCNLYMKYKLNLVLAPTVIITTLIITGCGSSSSGTSTPTGTDSSLSAEQELGKKLFFDVSLSSEGNQSCADCHSPSSGFADPVATQAAPVSEGSVTGEFGNRNAPTSSYAAFIPDFSKTILIKFHKNILS